MLIEASYRKAIENYYTVLDELAGKEVSHEQGLRPAFQNLLATVGKRVGWTLVPEQRLPNGRVPDGTLRDGFLLPRGYWEAKDSADDLNEEVKKKIAAGYPLANTIFEDTRRAVLYQDGQRRLEVELRRKEQLADLLHAFTSYAEPDIEQFEQAVTEFKARIPELAQGVLAIIARERKGNKTFVAAFTGFHELCRQALDPRISEAQIDEMLVQHLLTERLFRTVFDNSDFANRNAIAAEIEKVIGALTSRSFIRAEFLKSLDRFYVAIEDGSNRRENITDWALGQYRARYGEGVTKWDIFYYVYALLHHPAYRERYAENLKRELPRIPYVPAEDFPRYVEAGRALAELHLNYESAAEYPLSWRENNSEPFCWRVEKMKLTREKDAVVVNDSLTLAGIPPEVYDYRLGNRSALELVIDQYRVSTDKRSGISSDPNREDDPEYIVRLVGRVVTVSLETVKLVNALPEYRTL